MNAVILPTALKPRVRYSAEDWPAVLERMSAPAYPRRAVDATARLTEDFRTLIVEVRCSDGCVLQVELEPQAVVEHGRLVQAGFAP